MRVINYEFEWIRLKLNEARFFLDKLAHTSDNPFEQGCYFNAFVTSARSVTFVMQKAMKRVRGFPEWYEKKSEELGANKEAALFRDVRNSIEKEGDNWIECGDACMDDEGRLIITEYLRFPKKYLDEVPDYCLDEEEDLFIQAHIACERHYARLEKLVDECYKTFSIQYDADTFWSKENFRAIGITPEDLEAVLGIPQGWTASQSEDQRIKALRQCYPSDRIYDLLIN